MTSTNCAGNCSGDYVGKRGGFATSGGDDFGSGVSHGFSTGTGFDGFIVTQLVGLLIGEKERLNRKQIIDWVLYLVPRIRKRR